MIAQESIEAVKDRASILEIIGESVALKRQSSGYVGLCPFHNEKTPSFHVRDNDDYYHCFGCGASGNVITFLMQTRGLSFPEAIEELAQRYGITLKREGSGRDTSTASGTRKEEIYRLNALAHSYYQKNLSKAPKAVSEYLKERGLNSSHCAEFEIGYAIEGPTSLIEHFTKLKVPIDTLLQSGLARRREDGSLYDIFRNRIIFPVFSDKKRIAGFAGRSIPAFSQGSNAPKYINSPETQVYQKSQILYNLPAATESMRRSAEVFVVEGYLDVISLWRAGIRNVVATCGTAFTSQHAQRLSRLVRRVVVLFDGDAAGRDAAAKSFVAFINSGIEAYALFLPEEHDPDSYVKYYGTSVSEHLADLRRTSLLECYVKSLAARFGESEPRNLGASAKGRVCEDIVRILSKVENKVELAELITTCAFLLGVREELLSQLFQGSLKAIPDSSISPLTPDNRNPTEQEPVTASRPEIGALPRSDRELLLAVMAHRDLADCVLHDPDVCTGLHPSSRQFIEGLSESMRELGPDTAALREALKILLFEFGESWITHWRKAHEVTSSEAVNLRTHFAQCCVAIKKNKLNQAIRSLEAEISSCNDALQRASLQQERLLLIRRLMEFKLPNSTKSAQAI